MRNSHLFLTILALLSPQFLLSQEDVADLVITGGVVATLDKSSPKVDALAVKDGRILAIGSNRRIKKFIGDETNHLRLNGQFVMPGFIEGHAHFIGLGESLMMLRLAKASSWDEIVKEVAEAAELTPAGEWIVGRGWHQSKWDSPPIPNVEGYPTAETLSAVSPNHPVLLTHASGHMSIANDYAMRLAGIDSTTENPDGGEILKDSEGKPTGVFRETAELLIEKIRSRDEAKRSVAEQESKIFRAIELASQDCLKNGITSFQDAGTSFKLSKYLRRAALNDKLGVRLWVMIRDTNENLEAQLPTSKCIGLANDFLTIRAVKRSIDGALGPHGAWLLAPYSDLPQSTGRWITGVIYLLTGGLFLLGYLYDFFVMNHIVDEENRRQYLAYA